MEYSFLFFLPFYALSIPLLGGARGGLIQQLTYQTHRKDGQHKPTNKPLNNGQVTGQSFDRNFSKAKGRERIDAEHERIQHFDEDVVGEGN